MTNANSFHSAVVVLLMFGVIYFAALGCYEIKKQVQKRMNRRSEKKKEDD